MTEMYKEYMELFIEDNKGRIEEMREQLVKNLDRVAYNLAEKRDALKNDNRNLHSIDTLVGNTQGDLLDILRLAHRIQCLQIQLADYESALKHET